MPMHAIQTKPTTQFFRRTVTEESKLKPWKVLVKTMEGFGYRLTMQPGKQVMRSKCFITKFIPYPIPGWWGWGGFQVWTPTHSTVYFLLSSLLSCHSHCGELSFHSLLVSLPCEAAGRACPPPAVGRWGEGWNQFQRRGFERTVNLSLVTIKYKNISWTNITVPQKHVFDFKE
jgi:hypothetical protein